MEVCISHRTAVRWLLRNPNARDRPDATEASAASPSVPEVAPGFEETRDLLDALASYLRVDDQGERVIDVLVSRADGRRDHRGVTCHVCTSELPQGSVLSMGRRGYSLLVTSPELTFLQIAATEDMRIAAYVGMALCSSYRIDEFESSGLADRAHGDAPLTSVTQITAYLRRVNGVHGVRAAWKALAYVRDGALSPPEGAIGVVAALPYALGGYACRDVSMNRGIRVFAGLDASGRRRYTMRYPDVSIVSRDARGVRRIVGIDYDPEITHGGEAKRANDVERGNQINGSRKITHFTFTERQRSSYSQWISSMEQVRIALGRRRPRRRGVEDDFDHERWETWHMLLERPPRL